MKNAWFLDFDYQQQMIYWVEFTKLDHPPQSMISVMNIDGSDVQVSVTMTTIRMNNITDFIFLLSKCL